MDEYAKQEGNIPSFKSAHACFTTGNDSIPEAIGLNSQYMASLKYSLMDAIVLSSVLGDHDVNPGNMLVVTNNEFDDDSEEIKQRSCVSRIDLGHAFNDLLSTYALLGGTVLNPNHPVIDFINREKIAGINAPSKLWRDYPGICSLEEMPKLAQSLAKIGSINEAVIYAGVEQARQAFLDLIKDMQANKDFAGVEHVHKSLV
ncbi:MAG: hypothetical protein ACRCXC_08320 [Legionella sp.]